MSSIIYALGEINDAFVLDAAPAPQTAQQRPADTARRRKLAVRWVAAAACFCIVAGGAYLVSRGFGSRQPASANTANIADSNNVANTTNSTSNAAETINHGGELPKLTLSTLYDGMGFGVTLLPKGEQPSQKMLSAADVPETLPAYRNTSYDPAGEPFGLNTEQLNALLKEYIDKLGITDSDIREYYGGQAAYKTLQSLTAASGDTRIEADANGLVVIRSSAETLDPENVNNILGFSSPEASMESVPFLSDGETGIILNTIYNYTDASEPRRQAELFISSADSADASGNRLMIYNSDLTSELIADYPAISLDKALELLEEGRFVKGSGIDSFPGVSSIVACDIRYEVRATLQMFVPYYHFWVKLSGAEASAYGYNPDTWDAYGELYVPAIDEKYLTPDSLVWN